MNKFQTEAALLFHSLVQIERHEFLGVRDKELYLPKFQACDSHLMCPPFMGRNYKKGGLVVLAINPGGGNHKSEARVYGDGILYPIVEKFKSVEGQPSICYWEEFVPVFKEAKKSYPIYQTLLHILNASKSDLDDICYLNFLPYRVRNDKYPTTKGLMREVIPQCINKFVEPSLRIFEPSVVLSFGKQVDKYIDQFWVDFPYYRVPWDRSRASKTLEGRAQVSEAREKSKELLTSWAANRR